jgi:hypothetical protein
MSLKYHVSSCNGTLYRGLGHGNLQFGCSIRVFQDARIQNDAIQFDATLHEYLHPDRKVLQ